jgi:CRISPR/Cas system-associated exonuclease Cas4 (RecB family)
VKSLKFKTKVSVLGKINAYLKKVANPKFHAGDRRIKPSDLGSPCYRKIIYSYLRVEPDTKIEPKTKRIFDTGDAYHDMMKEWVKGAGILIEYKDPKTGKLPINKYSGKPDSEFPIVVTELGIKKGKIDAILLVNGQLWIGEFKSMKDEKFHVLKAPQDDHQIQANTYVHLFEHCLARGDYKHIKELAGHTEVQGVIYLYIDKDNSEIKEYVLPKSDEGFEIVVEKIARIMKYVTDKELPPKTEHYCYFCSYNRKCKREFNPLAEADSE